MFARCAVVYVDWRYFACGQGVNFRAKMFLAWLSLLLHSQNTPTQTHARSLLKSTTATTTVTDLFNPLYNSSLGSRSLHHTISLLYLQCALAFSSSSFKSLFSCLLICATLIATKFLDKQTRPSVFLFSADFNSTSIDRTGCVWSKANRFSVPQPALKFKGLIDKQK